MTGISRLDAPPLKLLSVVIPARDEEGCIAATVEHLHVELRLHAVPHEILVVDDGSTDGTWRVLQEVAATVPQLRPLRSEGPHGFGRAVAYGLDQMRGDAAVVMMADESDDCRDVVAYWRALNEGWDCVFGSRFAKGGGVIDYPPLKRVLNRLVNRMIMLVFRIRLNDTTNAFKAYRRTVIAGCRPFLSPHFNLTVELPLKAIVRGYSWTTMAITWRNRRSGTPKLKLTEMGSRYFFIIMYVWLEKYFSRGDYRRQQIGIVQSVEGIPRDERGGARLPVALWVSALLLGALLLALPEASKVALVPRDGWQIAGGFAQNAKPAPEEVSRAILESPDSVFWRSWRPGVLAQPGSVVSSPFVPPSVLAVPFAGYPGRPGIELYVECLATSARKHIARGNAHEDWVERTLWLGPSWCPSEARLVTTSSSLADYVAVGTPFRSSWLSYMKESVFVVTFIHAVAWGLLLVPGMAIVLVSSVRRSDVALLAAIPATLALGYASFFAVYLLGRAGVAFVVLVMAACGIVCAARAREIWTRFGSEALGRAFLVAFAVSLGYASLVYTADLGIGTWAGTYRFAPAIWSSDAQLQQMVAEGIYEQRPVASILGGGWRVSDRPPLLSGLFLLGRPLWQPLLGVADNQRLAYLFYQVSGLVACTLWVIPAWILLSRVIPDPVQVGRAVALVATTGVVLFNSIYVWPKMLAGTLGLGAYLVLTAPTTAGASRAALRSYTVAGLLAGLALMCHGGVAYGLLPVFAPLLLKPSRGRLTGLLIAAVAALVVVLPWTVWQRTVDPPGNALVKFALAGTWGMEDPTKGIWATVRDVHATMTVSDWLRMRRDSVATLLGHFTAPIISWYWRQEYDSLGGLRAMDFLFLFPGLRAGNLGWVALVILAMGSRPLGRETARIAGSWVVTGLLGIAVGTLINFKVNIVHCQSYLSILLLLLGLYGALSRGPRWLYYAAALANLVYFSVVWIWSPLTAVDLRLDFLGGFVVVTAGLVVCLLRKPRQARVDLPSST